MYIGIYAHKLSESVCVTDKDGTILEEYRIDKTRRTGMSFHDEIQRR
ncbi:hypothetical protein ACNF40_01005 [Cuniculiplasma sp. SKW4]